MIAQDSATFWFPRLQEAAKWFSSGILIPKTIIVDYDEELLYPSFSGRHSKEYDRLYYAVGAALAEIGSPAFIRTDLTSAKHAGKRAYKVETRMDREDDWNDALLTTLSHA